MTLLSFAVAGEHKFLIYGKSKKNFLASIRTHSETLMEQLVADEATAEDKFFRMKQAV